jgi:hypothetical protein
MSNNDINNENILNKEIDITLEEYKTLREEILENTKTRLQLISFGFTAIVAIFGIGLQSLTSDNISQNNISQIDDFFLFCILIPLTCFSVLFLWGNSMNKTLLIGDYIAKEIEPKITILLLYLHQVTHSHRPHIIFPISWENYMRTKTVGLDKENLLFLIFGGSGLISWTIGVITTSGFIISSTLNIGYFGSGVIVGFIFLGFGCFLYSKLQKLYKFRDESPKKHSKEKDNQSANKRKQLHRHGLGAFRPSR